MTGHLSRRSGAGLRQSSSSRGAGGFRGAVLGIETSCDETSAAVVEHGEIRGHVVASQDGHAAFGGVVPEIAARAHLRLLEPVVAAALREAGLAAERVAGVGVTVGPGLVGALLVGVSWAKGFAFARSLPLLGVHHMEAHLFAPSLERSDARPPFVALLVSGGHTMLLHARAWGEYELLGETRDDAAGEAFDKAARRLGLGYPGGPAIERLAGQGEPDRFQLPRPMLSARDTPDDDAYFEFSFAGLKTALSLQAGELEASGELEDGRADLAAEFQAAVVDVLAAKTVRAVEHTGCRRVLLGGGVACNRVLQDTLRRRLGDAGPAEAGRDRDGAGENGVSGAGDGELIVSSPRLSTDNGAMVARLAEYRLHRGERSDWTLNADPALPFPGLRGAPVTA